jgi:hypothetical protein
MTNLVIKWTLLQPAPDNNLKMATKRFHSFEPDLMLAAAADVWPTGGDTGHCLSRGAET